MPRTKKAVKSKPKRVTRSDKSPRNSDENRPSSSSPTPVHKPTSAPRASTARDTVNDPERKSVPSSMEHEHPLYVSLSECFLEGQEGDKSHAALVKRIYSIYKKTTDLEFIRAFLQCISHFLSVFERNPYVDLGLELCAAFLTHGLEMERLELNTTSKVAAELQGDVDVEDMHPLTLQVINFLLKTAESPLKASRLRSCQLIYKIMRQFDESVGLSDDMFNAIQVQLLLRVRDKVPRVRIHAVNALSRMQDPADRQDKTVKAYQFLIAYDPSPEVRNAVLHNLSLTKFTINDYLSRTRDVNDFVRRSAYEAIADRVAMGVISIAQRMRLLQDGLTDSSELVRRLVSERLLPVWLEKSCDGRPEKLLYKLDVTSNKDTCTLVMRAHFKRHSFVALTDEFCQLPREGNIPTEITPEVAFYWRSLVQYLRFTPDGREREETLDLCDGIMPTLYQLSQYLNRYVVGHPSTDDEEENEWREFTGVQLCDLIVLADCTDEAGRKRLREVVENLLRTAAPAVTIQDALVRIYMFLYHNVHDAILELVKLLSEMRDAVRSASPPPANPGQMAPDEALLAHDESHAAASPARPPGVIVVQDQSREDDAVLERCLHILCEILRCRRVKRLDGALKGQLQFLIIPSITNVNPFVRNVAFKALGLCSILDLEVLKKHLILMLQTVRIDQLAIRLNVLKTLFDVLLLRGMSLLTDALPGHENAPEGFISLLVQILEETEESELHATVVEGLCKLLLHHRLFSHKVFARLVVMWFNPVTKGTRVRQVLSTFLPAYARRSRENHVTIDEAFLKIIADFLTADMASPLSKVDVEKVALFLVSLTDLSIIEDDNERKTDYCVHALLALRLLRDVMLDEVSDDFVVRLFMKCIMNMNLVDSEPSAVRDVRSLLYECLEFKPNKPIETVIQRTIAKVEEALSIIDSQNAENLPPDHLGDEDEQNKTLTHPPDEKHTSEEANDNNDSEIGAADSGGSSRSAPPQKDTSAALSSVNGTGNRNPGTTLIDGGAKRQLLRSADASQVMSTPLDARRNKNRTGRVIFRVKPSGNETLPENESTAALDVTDTVDDEESLPC